MAPLSFPQGRRFDIACLGRLAVDFYADQYGCSLENASSFSKYLGGSSANTAFGVARLGLRSAVISRVGNEQMGRFLVQTLQREGCDTSQVQVDPQRLTALVILAIRDRETFPLLFIRENCADMAIDAAAIDESFIADCRCLAVTGTHLSTENVRKASLTALGYARRHGTVTMLDIDYRPVLWGLTSRGEGERRYVAAEAVTAHLQAMLPHFDLVIGTIEEFLIAGGVPGDLEASLAAVRRHTDAVLVVKRGPMGCAVVEGEVPPSIDEAVNVPGERIEVLNVLGAGDAFAAGLMTGLLSGKDFVEAAKIANACGGIVVSRHGCAPAMPTPAELAHWFSGRREPRPDEDVELAHLHRVTVPRQQWPELFVLAFDHRPPFFELAREAGAPESRIPRLKGLLVEAVAAFGERHALARRLGVLIDDRYGEAALHAAVGRGWWIGRPVELPGSRPLAFDRGDSVATALRHWPLEQCVKCLVHYDPDDAVTLRLEQERVLLELWEAVCGTGHELMLEVIAPPSVVARDAAVLRAVTRFYNLGIRPDWWKLAPMSAAAWGELDALVRRRDPHCRGALVLGLNQPAGELAAAFGQARAPVVKGFAVGRTIWVEPARAWLAGKIDDAAFVATASANFAALIEAWRAARTR